MLVSLVYKSNGRRQIKEFGVDRKAKDERRTVPGGMPVESRYL